MNDVLLVLVLGATVSGLSQRLKFPNAVAQVVLGVLLGSAVLGWVAHSATLHTLGEVGVVLLLGVAGLELGIDRLKAAGWAGVIVAALGIVFSLAGGYALGTFYGSPNPEAMYVGLALAATSIGITVQVLQQFGLIGHRVAEVVIAAAVIDDVLALFLLAAAHGLLSDGLTVMGTFGLVGLAVAVLGGVYGLCRVLTRWASRRGLIDNPWARAAWILGAIFGAALLTHALELSAVVGGFFAGLGTGEGLTRAVRELSLRILNPLVLVLMPFFFVMVGVQAQWDILNESAVVWFVAGLIALAIITKAAGGLMGTTRAHSWTERWLIAFGMVPRGEITLVIVTLGFDQGHVTHHVFVAVVLMAIVLSIVGPLLMAPFAKRLASEELQGKLP